VLSHAIPPECSWCSSWQNFQDLFSPPAGAPPRYDVPAITRTYFTPRGTAPERVAHHRDRSPANLFEFLRHLPHNRHLPVPHELQHLFQRLLDPVRRFIDDDGPRLLREGLERVFLPFLTGRNPSNTNLSVGSPLMISAARSALGPGEV